MSIHIFGGGTLFYVSSHFSLGAEAKGTTARTLAALLGPGGTHDCGEPVGLTLTVKADLNSKVETNADVEARLREVLKDPSLKVVVFNVAACDVEGFFEGKAPGKYASRIKTRAIPPEGLTLKLIPAPKILSIVKKLRPDVKVVGFKTTTHDKPEDQLAQANRMSAEHSLDLVLANDTGTRYNMIVRGNGQATLDNILYASHDRDAVLLELAFAIKQLMTA